jgi:hypothetical protein
MADDIRTVLKDFNKDLLNEELVASALPFESVFLAGFQRQGSDPIIVTPTAAPRLISHDRVNDIKDFADPGEIRFTFSTALTVAEGVILDDLLTAHDPAGTTSEQDRINQDAIDIDRLITDLPNVTTMSNPDFQSHVERLTRVVVREFKSPRPPV